MITDANGRALVEAFEGCMRATGDGRFTTYYDSVHVLTIGYGHTNLGNVPPHINPGDIWTQAQCDQALSDDLQQSDIEVNALLPDLLVYQHSALASFQFNTGDLARSSIPAKIRAGQIDAAMDTLLLYCHADGEVLPGLVRRRHAERLMFLGQVQSALVLAGAHAQIAAAAPHHPAMAKASMRVPV